MNTSTEDKSRSHIVVRRTAQLLVVMVAFLILCEIGLRFVIGLGNPVLIAEDPACAYILKPDQTLTRFFVHTHINHYGMRSDDIAPSHNSRVLRIMFVGDSIPYGTSHVDQKQLFSEILHRELPALVRRPVEVLNASASAWAIDNELSYVQSRGLFNSNLVLLVLNSADITQSRSTIDQVGDDLPRERPLTAIGEIFTRYVRRRLFRVSAHIDAGDTAQPQAEGIVRANLADCDTFHSVATQQHAQMAILYLPFRKDIPNVSRRSLNIISTWARTHDIPLLDLTPTESAYSIRDITLDGAHLNAKGHLVVARQIEQLWQRTPGL